MDLEQLKWDERGLIACIFQDAHTGEVLTLAYMNREALTRSLETGKVWLYRRSHGRLMQKGETSGNVQIIHEIRTDCDRDCLLVRIEQVGGVACHTGRRSCFYLRVEDGELREAERQVD